MMLNGPDVSRVINEIMNSPNFNKAAMIFVEKYLYVFTSYKYIVKLQSDEGRYVVTLQQAAFLFDTQSENELTASALHSFAVENNLSTKSRVSAGLALAVMGRYLLWEPSKNDKRMKVFSPTERYLQLTQDSFDYYAHSLAALDEGKYGYLRKADFKMIGKISRESVKIYLNDMRLAQTVRGMSLLSYRDGGMEIFVRMLQEAQYFTVQRNTQINLPFAAIARELAISRSQVQKLVKSLADAGLIRLHEQGGKNIELMPAFQGFAAEILASMIGICAHASENVRMRVGELEQNPA